MVTNSYSRWKVGTGTFVLWFLALACVVFWGLKLSSSTPLQSAPSLPSAPTVVDVQSLMRVLGGTEVARTPVSSAPTRYNLIGVLAGTRSGHGAALIEIDGKPAKTYRIGAPVAEGMVLQSVGRREANLGFSQEGPVSVVLQMPLKSGANGAAGNMSSPPPPYQPPIQTPMMPQGTTPGITPGITPGLAPDVGHPAQNQ